MRVRLRVRVRVRFPSPQGSSPPRVASGPTRSASVPQPRGPNTASTTAAAAAATASASPLLQPEATATPPAYGLVVGLGDPVSDILVRLEDESLASRVFTTCGRV